MCQRNFMNLKTTFTIPTTINENSITIKKFIKKSSNNFIKYFFWKK